MIPDFKTYIRESVWGDIYKRGAGEQVREEDDIDHLYNKDLCEYIKERYQTIFNRRFDIEYFGQSVITSRIHIPLYVTTDVWNPQHLISLIIFREPDDFNRTVEIHLRQKKHLTSTFKYFFDKLKNEFDLVVKEGTVKINPKDGGKITNRFFISVLDFCIDNLEKITVKSKYTARLNITRKESITESVWGDIYKRGAGEQVRTEDDVNLMDREGLYEYIKKRYESKVAWMQTAATTIVIEPIVNIYLSLNYRNNIPSFIVWSGHIDMAYVSKSFLKKLKERFKLRRNGNHEKNVTEKDGTINNQTFIDFVDMFMENKDNILNESVWGDIYKRGAGEQVRKEDDVNLMDAENFAEYLKQHYELKTPNNLEINVRTYTGMFDAIDFPIIDNSGSPDKHSPGFNYDECTIYYSPNTNKIENMCICFHNVGTEWKHNMIQKLKENYILKTVFVGNGDRIEYKIFPKEDEINNSFVLEVIDFVSDNIQEPYKRTLFKK